jgi:hypothetical protein
MMTAEMLVILGCGAVLPYVAEAVWSKVKERRTHQ